MILYKKRGAINKIISTTLFLSISIFGLSNTPVKIKSKIKKVVVYQQGAQIQRRANYTVSKGINKIYIESISPQIDANSIQITATGNIILLDSKYSVEYPKPALDNTSSNIIPLKIRKEIASLTDSIFDYSYKSMGIQYKIDVLNSEKRIIENNGTIKGSGKVNDSIPLLVDAIEFYHQRMNKINFELLKQTKEKAVLKKTQNRMNARLQTLNSYNRNNHLTPPSNKPPVYKITITVSAKETTSGRVNISYLVNNAGWIPQYDLRSKAIDNTIDLTYKAQVYQNTGIKWNNIRLSLSTNNPYANKTKPELQPWYVYYANNYSHRAKQKSISYSTKDKKELAPQTIQSEGLAETNDSEMEIYEEKATTSAKFTQMIEQLISVEYAIDLPYTIESNNERYMVLVDSKTLKTNYKYYAVPKIDLSSYLVAQITDLDNLNLIPGDATIFHDGAYLGTTYLNPSIMSDTMNLSLGKDPKVLLKRTLLKKESKQKVIGDKIIKTYAYTIEIKNHKNKTTKITVQDQLPITQNTEIEIEVVNLSKGKQNKTTGLIEWDLKLKAKETKKIDLIYTVKYSKNQNINLAALN
jgi:uncharacterized protein (TIGR02231 family)